MRIVIDNHYNITKKNEPLKGTSGSRIGNFFMPFPKMVEIFGKPNTTNDEYKTDAEWEIETPFGIIAIYNWKDGKNYWGTRGLELEELREWHIGGEDIRAAKFIEDKYNDIYM